MINYEDVNKINVQTTFVSPVTKPSKVMVVDDQPLSLLHAVDLIRYQGYEIVQTNNSVEAFSLANHEQPDVILMDIMMPEVSGLDIAKKLKNHPQTQSIPVVLMSVAEDINLRNQALNIGVEDVLLKPLDSKYLYSKLKRLSQQKRLNDGLNQTQKVLLDLAKAIDQRSSDDRNPTLSLPNLVFDFAQYLGLNDNDIQELVFAAYLHDIGTISIPEEILTKKDKLTPAEQNLIRQHVIVGEQICQPLANRPNLLNIIRHHHEKYDGSGYPDHLQGEQIPYLAQVFQLVDIYHALVSKRSYKPAYSYQQSLTILEEEAMKGWRNPILFQKFKRFILLNPRE